MKATTRAKAIFSEATTVGGSSAITISDKRYLVDSQGRSFAQPTRLRLPSLRLRLQSIEIYVPRY